MEILPLRSSYNKMLLAAPLKPLLSARKPLLSARLVPPSRLPSSSSCTDPDRIFSPISSSAVPNDPTGGDDRAAGTSSRKSKVYPAIGALRGSDILLAMHEGVARKEEGGSRVPRTFRKGKKRRESKSGDDTEQLLRANYDYGSIRPIEIKSDWGPRMEEFERRIQELRSRYHY